MVIVWVLPCSLPVIECDPGTWLIKSPRDVFILNFYSIHLRQRYAEELFISLPVVVGARAGVGTSGYGYYTRMDLI